jgi:hypothetical protein
VNDAVPAEHQASEVKVRPSDVQIILLLEKEEASTYNNSLHLNCHLKETKK